MRRARPEELNEDARPVALLQLSRERLGELFPVELSEVDPLSAAEPSLGGVVQLAGGPYVLVLYGEVTGQTEVSLPLSAQVSRDWAAFQREVPVDPKEILWISEKLAPAKGEVTRVPVPASKRRESETALTLIERQFGKGSIMRLGSKEFVPISAISTGSIGVDAALGVGGLPRGRIVEIFGPESSGKTTLALHVIAEAQKTGGLAAFIDAEHALDAEYARRLGVDVDNLLVSQPDSGEQALEIAEVLVRSGAIDVVVIDSVAALVPRAELEGEMGDSHVGLQARLMSQALRKLTGIVSKSRTSLIFINQIREKIGVMFGSPETTTGGRALKFYASVRLDIRRMNQIKEGEEVVGSRVKVKVVKNKCAAPFRQAEFDVGYGEGISRTGELIDIGMENKLIGKSGSWLSYGDLRLGQGRENAKRFLQENPNVSAEIESKLRGLMGIGNREIRAVPLPAAAPAKKHG